MLINLRNALMEGKRLPYDAEVEYLGSTGTEVLDTGYIPVEGDVLAFPANALYGTGGGIDGCITSRYRRLHGFNSLRAVYVGDSAYSLSNAGAVWNYDSEWQVDLSRHTLTFGDTTIPVSSDASLPDVSFCFLARHNNMSGNPIYDNHKAGSRFRYFKVYRNQELIRDYIPVRVGTVGATYDRRGVGGMNPDGSPRNDGMYYNRGTGDFVLGLDKAASNGGGGYKRKCVRRSYRRSLRPSVRFWRTPLWKEVA